MTSTALIIFDIPGRARGGVRLYPPSSGKNSYRIVWTDDEGRQRERTRTDLAEAEALATAIAEGLAYQQTVVAWGDPTLGDLLVHYLDGPGRSQKWTSEKSARRPAQIARRILTAPDLSRTAAAYLSPKGPGLLQDIMDRAAGTGCKPGGSEYAKAGALLKTLFDVGARDGLIALPHGNPMEDIRYRLHQFTADPAPEMLTVNYIGPELRPPTDRVLDFIDATHRMFGSREARYVEVLAFAGLRPGEANGLTRRQVRTDRPGLLVDQQVLELNPREAALIGGDSQPFRLPKWNQARNAFYPAVLRDGLFDLLEDQAPGRRGVLFPSRGGRAIRWQNNWRRDVFNPVASHVGWPSREVEVRGRTERHWIWPVYAFRHHYANYLLKDLNLPLVSVARFMGHRDTRVTERMYLKTELDDLDIANRIYNTRRESAA